MSFVLLADILVRATPLMLAGVAVAIAFRGGVLNIGADGQLLIGATAAAWVGITLAHPLGWVTLPVVLLAGIGAGGAWASIAAILRTRFRVLEVISTIMLNFIATFTVSYLVRGPLQEPTHVYPQTDSIDPIAQLPRIMVGTRLHWGFLLALVVAGGTWWVIRSTSGGFRLRATGANPMAARSAGLIDTSRVTMRTFIVSGMIAGLAGAIEVSGVTFALYDNLSPGYGYTAIAVALLAALNPLWIIVTALLFGTLEVVANGLQRDANVPSTLAAVIEASVILIVIAIGQWRARQQRIGSTV